jgi:hypothetical protein
MTEAEPSGSNNSGIGGFSPVDNPRHRRRQSLPIPILFGTGGFSPAHNALARLKHSIP